MSVRRYLGVGACIVSIGLAFPLAGVASAKAPKLKVKLIEFKMTPARQYIAKGKTKFVAKNAGSEVHEFVIVKGDDPEALPTKADGSVDEDAIPKADEIGEMEDIDPGKSKSKTFKLKAGDYVIFCNIVDEEDDGTVVSHFAEGMYNTINVS